MAQLFGIDREPPIIDKRRRRLMITGAASLMAVLIGGSALLGWRASFTKPPEPIDQAVSLKNFQAFQQQVLLRMQENSQLLHAQQAEVKRLADQISALGVQIGALESSVVQEPIVTTNKVRSGRKKFGTPKLPRRLSTGGAALPAPVKPIR